MKMTPIKFKQEHAWLELDGEMVATFPENTPQKIRKMLAKSGDAFAAISSFVERVKTGGSIKPKTTVDEFEELLKQLED